eukprot:14462554-Ditylum_brightwellii.AAC.1
MAHYLQSEQHSRHQQAMRQEASISYMMFSAHMYSETSAAGAHEDEGKQHKKTPAVAKADTVSDTLTAGTHEDEGMQQADTVSDTLTAGAHEDAGMQQAAA